MLSINVNALRVSAINSHPQTDVSTKEYIILIQTYHI